MVLGGTQSLPGSASDATQFWELNPDLCTCQETLQPFELFLWINNDTFDVNHFYFPEYFLIYVSFL